MREHRPGHPLQEASGLPPDHSPLSHIPKAKSDMDVYTLH